MIKKKILIIINNLKIGGIQKALLNFVSCNKDVYEITLLAFKKTGAYLKDIPANVDVIEIKSLYKYLGISQSECKSLFDKFTRGTLALLTRVLGFGLTARIISLSQRKKYIGYDAVIAYQHCSQPKQFYGGVAEFVLNHTESKNKVVFIHCDYVNSGTCCKRNNRIYKKFDRIACVSKSVGERFLSVLPELADKTIISYNCIDEKKIKQQADMEPYAYDGSLINIITVARLSKEKGIDRALTALKQSERADIKYYILGGGPERNNLEKQTEVLGLSNRVVFLGEDSNPYRYMKNADYLLLPSYHEAAPVVFQEAIVLNLPIITTRTLSADEMVGSKYGYVVNTTEELSNQLKNLSRTRGIEK